jgi:hypothetical protein
MIMHKKILYILFFLKSLFQLSTIIILCVLLCSVRQTFSQNSTLDDSLSTKPSSGENTRKLFGAEITNLGFGGPAIKFSYFNDQFAFMTGGRGACTLNNRYTLGGGGYGIFNPIRLPAASADTDRYFKMGYGGLEFGYLFYPGKKMNIGTSLLVAAGAAFWQNKPKIEGEKFYDNGFTIFPVLEPSLYSEFFINRFMRIHAGVSYRYVFGVDLDYITVQNMRGFSCYLGLLFGKS